MKERCVVRSSRLRSAAMTALRGSARSVPGMHIRDVLDAIAARHPDLISKFGGHAMAAGLTLELANLDRFARAFDEEVARWIGAAPRRRRHRDRRRADARGDRAGDGAARCATAGPWGQAFPEPCFDGVFLDSQRAHRRRAAPEDVGGAAAQRPHLRCHRVQLSSRTARRRASCPQGSAQLVYRLDINEYQGERRLQLLVDHVLPRDRLDPPLRNLKRDERPCPWN